MPRTEDHGKVRSCSDGFAVHRLPSEDDARRHDHCELIDAQKQNLLSVP